MDGRLPRKLAAILYADVAGYARLTGEDEDATHLALSEYLDLISTTIKSHRGQVMHYAGDAVLARFEAVVDALSGAVAIQDELRARNHDLPDERKVQFRIGVNLGDVIEDRGDIYGDGVNVAARLESLAEPGGICISETVYSAVGKKLDLSFEDMGDQEVKNIKEPVRAYRTRLEAGTELRRPSALTRATPRRSPATAIAVTIFVVVIGLVLIWLKPWAPNQEPASSERVALPLPDKPSIAVLPFANVSGDAGQDYFADGMTDDLITDLSKVSGLFVIARNSVFAYRGKAVNIRQISKELGVAYVLEGSVRKIGQKVRINVQLVDAYTGGHVWAERFDRDLQDIFVLQDEVASKIVSALAVKLSDKEESQLTQLPTQNLEAYDYFLRAERGLYTRDSGGLDEALSLYRKATSLDPTFARAWAGDARAAADVWRLDWFDVLPGQMARKRAYESAGHALNVDPNIARAYSVLAVLQVVDGHYDEAIDSARKAVSLKPNDADAYTNLALVLSYAGKPREAVAEMRTALRLDPKPPPGVYRVAGLILFMDKQYEDSIQLLRKAGTALNDAPHEELAMAYAQLGRLDEARVEIDGLLEVWPAANVSYYRVLYSHHKRATDLEFRLEALSKAGLPEWPFGYEGRESNRLEGAEIERLLYDRTWSGYRLEGEAIVRENTEDGLVMYRDPAAHGGRSRSAYMLIGNASVEGNKLCYRYEQFLLGRKYCGYIYRNPGGSRRDKNEYVDVNAIAIDFFTAGLERHSNAN